MRLLDKAGIRYVYFEFTRNRSRVAHLAERLKRFLASFTLFR